MIGFNIISNCNIVFDFDHISLTMSHSNIQCFNFLDDNHNSCLFLTYTGVKRNAAQNIIQ